MRQYLTKICVNCSLLVGWVTEHSAVLFHCVGQREATGVMLLLRRIRRVGSETSFVQCRFFGGLPLAILLLSLLFSTTSCRYGDSVPPEDFREYAQNFDDLDVKTLPSGARSIISRTYTIREDVVYPGGGERSGAFKAKPNPFGHPTPELPLPGGEFDRRPALSPEDGTEVKKDTGRVKPKEKKTSSRMAPKAAPVPKLERGKAKEMSRVPVTEDPPRATVSSQSSQMPEKAKTIPTPKSPPAEERFHVRSIAREVVQAKKTAKRLALAAQSTARGMLGLPVSEDAEEVRIEESEGEVAASNVKKTKKPLLLKVSVFLAVFGVLLFLFSLFLKRLGSRLP